MSFFLAGAAVIKGGLSVAKAIKGSAEKKKAKAANDKAKAQMEKDKEAYMQLDTSNPYMNMENTMEDLTVNTQAADFAAEQSQASTANVLNNMKQSAGGSGIAALAQAMANQGQIGAQKASVSIAQQEKSNQDAERKEAGNIQNLEREGEIQSRNMKQSLAGTALSLSAGEVTQSANDIANAQASKEAGMNAIGSAVGSFTGGIG